MSTPSQATTDAGGRASGLALILFTLVSWASVPLFLRYLGRDCGLDPLTQNGWRYAISALFWLPYLLWAQRRGRLPSGLWRAALVPTLFNIAGQTLFAWGPTLLEPGFFTFVFRSQIVFVMLGAYWLFPSERAMLRSPRFWAGLLLVALGSAGMIALAPPAKGGVTVLGIVVAIMAGVLFAGYGLAVRACVARYAPVLSFGVICNYTAVLAVTLMLALGTRAGAAALDLSGAQWGVLGASALIGIAISHVSYYAAIRRLGVSFTLGLIQLQPVLTAAGSLLLYDERLSPAQWSLGALGIVGAVVMLGATGRRAAAAAADDAP